MASRLLILVGTKKGAFVVEGDPARDRFTVRGPYCETMPIAHLTWDPATRMLVAGAGSPWFGPTVWRSPRDSGGLSSLRARWGSPTGC